MSDSFWLLGLYPYKLLCPWNSPGKNTGVVAMPSSRATSWPRNRTCVSWGSCFAGRFFITEPPVYTIELKEKKNSWRSGPMHFTPMFLKDQVYIYLVFALSCYLICVIPHTVLVFSVLFFFCIFSPQFSHFMLRVGHDWATSLSLFTFMHWRRKWQPTPVFLTGESQGRGSLVGCRLWGSRRVGHDWGNLAAAACCSCLLFPSPALSNYMLNLHIQLLILVAM